MLGRCSDLGLGMPQNSKEALKYYKQAAELQDAEALYELGNYYLNQNNPDYDPEEALGYFEDAREHGYSPALLGMAKIYFEGLGIDKDIDYAKDLATKAKEMGNPDAEIFLRNNFEEEE